MYSFRGIFTIKPFLKSSGISSRLHTSLDETPIKKLRCTNITLDAPLTVAGETLECVDSLKYIVSVIIRDICAQKDRHTLRIYLSNLGMHLLI